MKHRALFEKLIGLADHPFLEVLEKSYCGRGIYLKASSKIVPRNETLLSNVPPLASGNNYLEMINQIMLKASLQQANDEEQTIATTIAQLTYPLNLIELQRSAEEEKKITADIKAVINYVNDSAKGKLELVDIEKSIYLRFWGVLSLNAIRSENKLNLYGAISLLNHSCFPTCGISFEPKTQNASIVVIGKALMPQMQLTIDYCENEAATRKWSQEEKKTHLFENYAIICTGDATCKCLL